LKLLHRHITGAVPIRRNTKDLLYLATLKAYIAQLLRRHDLLFYLEGGRSYSGELKPPKTGLIHASMQAARKDLILLPMAVAYDVILEDHVLARQGSKRKQKPLAREIAELLRYAVGYQTRAFVTFGDPIPLSGLDSNSRRDVLDIAHQARETIGRLHKVLPTALVATTMRPSLTARELAERIERVLDPLHRSGANLAVDSGKQAVAEGVPMLASRRVLASERGRIRIRDRNLLRYYARSIQHLLPAPTKSHHTH
jgi:glycerol-3-phosphate O-acyltransferase